MKHAKGTKKMQRKDKSLFGYFHVGIHFCLNIPIHSHFSNTFDFPLFSLPLFLPFTSSGLSALPEKKKTTL